jgi:hypothetical protein
LASLLGIESEIFPGKEQLKDLNLIHEGDSESNTLLAETKFTLATPLKRDQ